MLQFIFKGSIRVSSKGSWRFYTGVRRVFGSRASVGFRISKGVYMSACLDVCCLSLFV